MATGNDKPTGKAGERRAAAREIAVLRVAKLVTDRGEQICRVRNISPGGVMVEALGTFWSGEAAAIELKSGGKAAGRIAWVDEGRIGIAFAAPIDPDDILAIDPDHPSRALRIAVSAEATLCLAGAFKRVAVEDIALGGVRIRYDDARAVGSKVFISLDELPSLAGTVRWQSAGFAGIAFEQPLALDVLAYWLASQSPPQLPQKGQ